MESIQINVAARTDKAGRQANQDSLWVCADLSNINRPDPEAVNNDKWITLGRCGALLVVADGMGGANSGEVASATVVKALREYFSTVPDGILGDADLMLRFMQQALVNADQEIKRYADVNPESRGMGSTTVMVWLYSDKILCAWVGDSRIYRFGRDGLHRLSHDHSYVQQLVDAGAITSEQAFDHPQGNIITRAIGDTGKSVEPDAKAVELHPDDIVLLCSDGLSGLLPDGRIQSIIAEHKTSGLSSEILQALWKQGEEEGWTDNATVIVASIAGKLPEQSNRVLPPSIHGPVNTPAVVPEQPPCMVSSGPSVKMSVSTSERGKRNWWNKTFLRVPVWIWCGIGCAIAVATVTSIKFLQLQPKEKMRNNTVTEQPIPVSSSHGTEAVNDHPEQHKIKHKKQEKAQRLKKSTKTIESESVPEKPEPPADKKEPAAPLSWQKKEKSSD